MPQLALTSPANVCDNAATRTVRRGPDVGTAIGKIWAVAATAERLFALGWKVLFQPEDGGAAFSPKAPFMVRTRCGAIGFYSPTGLEIRRGTRSQYPFPHNPALAAEFFARHRSSQ